MPHRTLVSRVRAAFTLVELLVVIGIIAVLVAMLLPVLNRARDAATTLQCLSNMRQVGTFMSMYANEDRTHRYPCGYYTSPVGSPTTAYVSYDDLLSQYDGRKLTDTQMSANFLNMSGVPGKVGLCKLYACPADLDNDANFLDILRRSYAYPRVSWFVVNGVHRSNAMFTQANPTTGEPGWTWKPTDVRDPGGTILLCEVRYKFARLGNNLYEMCDGPADIVPPAAPARQIASGAGFWGTSPTHSGGHCFNYLFCDGHAATLYPQDTLAPGTRLHDWTTANGMWTRSHQ